jgi:hypothetical protein
MRTHKGLEQSLGGIQQIFVPSISASERARSLLPVRRLTMPGSLFTLNVNGV